MLPMSHSIFLIRWSICHLVMTISTANLAEDIEWTYQEVVKTGKFCPERDSCSTEWRSEDLDWSKRNCFCDRNCSIYGDCCIDAETFDPIEQKVNVSSFSCVRLREYGLVNIRTKCSPEWKESQIRTACEDQNKSSSDPVGSMLVTSVRTGVTYSSYHCAVCNYDSDEGQYWKPWLECPSLQGTSNRFSNISKHFIKDNLKYNEQEQHWGVEINTLGVSKFHACTIDPYIPPNLPNPRPCHDPLPLDSCPPGYPDQNTVELCQSYTGLVYTDSSYRNIHCALCNNVNIEDLICIRLMSRNGWSFGNSFVSFSVLFDIDRSSGGQVGILETICSGQDVWDPFFHKCRSPVCEEGQTFVEGNCYRKGQVPAELRSTSTSTTSTRTTNTSPTSNITTTRSAISTTTSIDAINGITTLRTSNIPSSDSIIYLSTTAFTTITASTVITSLKFSTPSRQSSRMSSTTTKTSRTPIATTTASLTRHTDSTTTTSHPTTTTKKPPLSVNVMKVWEFEIDSLFAPEASFGTTTSAPPTTQTANTSTSRCFQLSPEEFRLENDSVYVPLYRQTFSHGQYWLSGPNVTICTDTFSGAVKFSPMMGYVTTACLGVSIVCLIFHLLISCIAPSLQSLCGRNLSSLSFALLIAYISFLLLPFTSDEISISNCKILAVLLYYFFLAAFFWMMIISFDVARSLKQATRNLRLTAGPQWGKFFIYSLVGWFLPAIIVTSVVVIDEMDDAKIPKMFKAGFGGSDIGLCWFSNRRALLIYFVVPVFVIMGLNIFFFIASALLVWNSKRSSAKITTSGPTINFFLYLRLSVMMGLTWTSGLVAGGLDIEHVWYIFLVLNTLQGLYILVFFTCNKKVVNSVKERLCCGSKAKEDRKNIWNNSAMKRQDEINSTLNLNQTSMMSLSLAGSGVRPFKYSANSYDQYHKYDQRFYS